MTDYIGGVAALIVVEYVLIISFCIFWYFKKFPPKVSETRYTDAAISCWMRKCTSSNTALICWRVFCNLWFFWFAFVAKWSYTGAQHKDPGYWFFTNWNLILLGVYFGFALLCSVQYKLDSMSAMEAGVNDVNSASTITDNVRKTEANCCCRNRFQLPAWYTKDIRDRVVNITGIMYDVAGANAIFVTVVAWGVLDHSGDFWNVTNHLTNSLFMLVEMVLNRIQTNTYNYVWSISWAFLYVCFAWIIVYTGTRPLPYFFLDTAEKPAAFGWYTGLLFVNFLFYVIWTYLNRFCKACTAVRVGDQRMGEHEEMELASVNAQRQDEEA
jgi:hypothetical protein